MRKLAISLGFVLLAALPMRADDVGQIATTVLERRCLSCHSEKDKKGGLSLARRDALLVGGESGPVVLPGKPAESLLLDYVTGEKPEMPKSGPPLTAEEVDAIRSWIAGGAKWPGDRVLVDRSLADTNWWSLQPIVTPPVPEIQNLNSNIRNPIDPFIAAALEQKGLAPSPEADRRTLIRRLSFDLVGLPPSPAEIDAFLADQRPDAYERLVDRLLASPGHGQRWARHWLDVVHFGETHGYDKDQPRPNAWPYRDYVIRALNADKPYGRFVEEQIAGDVLFPETADGIEALGFIAAGPWDLIGHAELPETKIDGKVARHLDRDDMVQNVTGTFLSLTVGCAQCHNHKFDPITQREYYQLQAVFAALDRHDKLYDREPAVARRRAELTSELARLRQLRETIEGAARERGGEELARLDDRLANLAKTAAGKERPEFGYHSAIENKQDAVKWVQVDLGQRRDIARIEIVACHDDFAGIGAGFGFPLRYKIEASDDPEFKAHVTVVSDRTTADVANPGVTPQSIDGHNAAARYVRITATKLAPRLPTDFIFALGELSVFTADGNNAAMGATVTSHDSIEAPVRWRRTNLVDGYYYGQAGVSERELSRLRDQRAAMLARLLSAEESRELARLSAAAATAEQALKELPPQQLVYAGTAFRGQGNFSGTGGQPRPIFLLDRGSVTEPGEDVQPGALACLPHAYEIAATKPGLGAPQTDEGLRRAALAQWITHDSNPLTWRSIVNRVWQYHFGRGIVDSPNDFGRMGALPTHPELLDWLAADLRDGGQSLKRLHRRIVTSGAYRQSSQVQGSKFNVQSSQSNTTLNDAPKTLNSASIDSDNRFLWRAARRRLEAEALRDAVLQIAGALDGRMGGPSFQDFVIEHPEHSPHYEYHLFDPDDSRSHRRSIYRFIVRSQPQPFMTTLDCADPSQRVDKRNESLSALQALATLNNGFMVVMSRRWSERLSQEGGTLSEQVDRAVLEAFGRRAMADEREQLAAYAAEHGLANLCRVLFNANEFAFVD